LEDIKIECKQLITASGYAETITYASGYISYRAHVAHSRLTAIAGDNYISYSLKTIIIFSP